MNSFYVYLKTSVLAKHFAADVAFERFHIFMNTEHMLKKVNLSVQCFLADVAAKSAHPQLRQQIKIVQLLMFEASSQVSGS